MKTYIVKKFVPDEKNLMFGKIEEICIEERNLNYLIMKVVNPKEGSRIVEVWEKDDYNGTFKKLTLGGNNNEH